MRKRDRRKVYVRRTRIGKGVFPSRHYQPFSPIGEITGKVIDDSGYGSDFCYDLGEGLALEPNPPFRFLNHSCDPNCAFGTFSQGIPHSKVLLVIAIKRVRPGEELTIDYGWSAAGTIPCRCRSVA